MASTIVTRYIKQTGRRRGPTTGIDRTGNNTLGSTAGVQNVKHPVFNWKQELVVAVTDGLESSYELRFKPIYDDTLSVYINGLLQRQGVDYTINEKIIQFNAVVPAGFNIVAKYNALQMES